MSTITVTTPRSLSMQAPEPTATKLGKRKASATNAHEPNPVQPGPSSKKAKKDLPKSGSSKRKLANGEKQAGGFVIVRAPSSQPLPSRSQSVNPSTAAAAATSSSQPIPPPKKPRAGSVDAPPRNGLGLASALPSHLEKLTETVGESPRIRHNRDMRQGSQAPSTPKAPGAGGHRRRSSSSSRRKRTSDLFEETGVLTTPHASVNDDSFFKLIDEDLSYGERVNQLLMWCTQRSGTREPDKALSDVEAGVVKSVTKDIQLTMAKRKLDFKSVPPSPSQEALKPNPQNVSNREFETLYQDQIKSYDREHNEWRALVASHKATKTKEAVRVKEGLAQLSDKAKGKLKSTDSPQSLQLSDATRAHSVLAAKVLGLSGPWDELEPQIEEKMQHSAFAVDTIHRGANAAKVMTVLAEGVLDLHNLDLATLLRARSNHAPPPSASSSASILPSSASSSHSSSTSPQALLRALAVTDKRRPPGMYDQTAVDARREVRRIEESGERPAGAHPPMTPRKAAMAPGTPRRGSTPGRR